MVKSGEKWGKVRKSKESAEKWGILGKSIQRMLNLAKSSSLCI